MALDPKEYSALQKARKGLLYPDLINSVALRNLPKETAEAEGWPTYYMPAACANGHTAARFVKNDLCVDCWRVRQKRETVYPTAKNRTYYKQRTPDAVTATGASVAVAPAAPIEPKPVEQKFLAAADELRDLDAAAKAVGWTRGLVESRASSNPVFRAALEDLCTRRGIQRTRAPDSTFEWSEQVEKNIVRRFVDVGLLEVARNDCGVTASDFFAHMERSPSFAAKIEAARPLALITLRERATKEAASGNDKLLRLMESEAPEEVSTWSVERCNAEIMKLLQHFDKQGLLVGDFEPRYYQHRETGQRINLRDFDKVQPDSSNLDLVSSL